MFIRAIRKAVASLIQLTKTFGRLRSPNSRDRQTPDQSHAHAMGHGSGTFRDRGSFTASSSCSITSGHANTRDSITRGEDMTVRHGHSAWTSIICMLQFWSIYPSYHCFLSCGLACVIKHHRNIIKQPQGPNFGRRIPSGNTL